MIAGHDPHAKISMKVHIPWNEMWWTLKGKVCLAERLWNLIRMRSWKEIIHCLHLLISMPYFSLGQCRINSALPDE
jgi:hypothetical protein